MATANGTGVTKHPKGLYVLFATEMWERFSFYTMTAMFGMMAMVPVLFATAGYVLVSSRGSAECTNPPSLRTDRDSANILDLSAVSR